MRSPSRPTAEHSHHRALLRVCQERDDALRQPGETHGRAVPGLLRLGGPERARAAGTQPGRRPVYLTGGPSRIRSFRESFEALLGQKVRSPPANSLCFEALGAAAIAAQQVRAEPRPPAARGIPTELIRPEQKRFSVLEPASALAERVTHHEGTRPRRRPSTRRASSAWISAPPEQRRCSRRSRPARRCSTCTTETRGNPVDAARRLVSARSSSTAQPDIRAIGVTGSGREAVATLLRAVFPDHREHRRPERDRRPCDGSDPLRRRRRSGPLGHRDRGTGCQVHPHPGRPHRRKRPEQGLQRRHRILPGGAGDFLRRARHRGVHSAGVELPNVRPTSG